MKNSEPTARKKNKTIDPNWGQVVITESSKEGRYSDLAKKVKPNKKKGLDQGMDSELLDPKKKKKQSNSESKKKACASSPAIIENHSDSELLRDTKKRLKGFKKKKARKLPCKQVQDCETLGKGKPGADFHANKECNRNILEVEGHDEELVMKRKKKKKEKRKHKPTCSLILPSGDSEESVKQISGKQKAGCQELLFSRLKKRRILGQKAVGDSVLVEKRHRNYSMGNQENSSGISEEGMASSVSKFQDAQSWDSHRQRQEDLACRSEKDSEAIKKKKQQLKEAATGCLSSLAKNQGNPSRVQYHSKKELGVVGTPKEVNKPAKKKKKKREAGDESHSSQDGQDLLPKVRAPGGKEKRKKAKKAKVEHNCVVRNGGDRFENSQEQRLKKKRKDRGPGSSQDNDQETSWKEAKMNKESKKQDTEDEIKLVAFRKGNCDEVNIDKVRRQALQEDIDRVSGKTKTAKEELDNQFGQWSTATFETSEQKATFLRLMGGFKKGMALPQTSPANDTKPNMALDRSKEQKLQYNLQAEFEKAVAFKNHQGIGLGFQPTPPSRVHIDKYASKSIKFED